MSHAETASLSEEKDGRQGNPEGWKPPRKRKGSEHTSLAALSLAAPLNAQAPPLADDLLEGAGAVACFLYGSERYRRKVYWLAEIKALPLFRIGNTLCGRRSTLERFIEDQEREGL